MRFISCSGTTTLALVLLATAAASAAASGAAKPDLNSLLRNGSFEGLPDAEQNYTRNPGLIATLDGWQPTEGMPYWIRTRSGMFSVPAQDGDAFVGLQNSVNAARPCEIAQKLSALEPGKPYTLTGYVRSRNAASETGAWSAILRTGAKPARDTLLLGGTPEQTWTLFSKIFIAPDATAASPATLALAFRATGADQMVFFDNIRILPGAIEQVAPVLQAGGFEGLPETVDNYTRNPADLKALAGWRSAGPHYWIRDGAKMFNGLRAKEGQAYLGIQDSITADKPKEIHQPLNALIPGRDYILSGWVRARNAASETATFTVKIRNAGTDTTLVTGAPKRVDWEPFHATITATKTALPPVLLLGVRATGQDQMIFFDDIQVTLVSQ
jgi:hypothetical protein